MQRRTQADAIAAEPSDAVPGDRAREDTEGRRVCFRRRTAALPRALPALILLSFGGTGAVAQQAAPAPPTPARAAGPALDAENLAGRLQDLEARTDLSAERKERIRQDLENTAAFLCKAAQEEAVAASYREALETAPGEAKAARDRVASIPAAAAAGEAPDPEIPPAALEIERFVIEAESALARLKSRLADVEKELQGQQDRQRPLLDELDAARTTPQKAASALPTERAALDDPLEREARAGVLDAQHTAAESEIRRLEAEQLSYQARFDLLTAQRDLRRREVAEAETRTQALRDLLKEQRALEVERARQEAEEALKNAAWMHPAVRSLAEGNAELSLKLAEVTDQANRTTAERKGIVDRLERLARDIERAETQIEMAGLSESFAAILLDQRLRLPQKAVLRRHRLNRADELGKARLARFHFEQVSEEIGDPGEAAARVLKKDIGEPLPDAQKELLESQIREMLASRLDLARRLQAAYGDLIREIASLDFEHAQYAARTEAYAGFLDERLLWIRSSEPLQRSTLQDAVRAARWLIGPGRLREAGLALADLAGRRPLLFAAALFIAAGLSIKRRALGARLASLEGRTRRVSTDRFALTVYALYLSLLRAAPVPLIAAFIGWQFQQIPAASDWLRALGVGLVRTSWIVGVGSFLREMCLPRGVACAHCRWGEQRGRILRRHLLWFIPVATVFNLVAATCNGSGDQAHANSLGRLAFIGAALALGLFLHRVLKPLDGILADTIKDRPDGWLSRTRVLWHGAAAGAPAVLAAAAATGYYYAAVTLLRSTVMTLVLFTAAAILYALLLRWFSIRARRLAVRQEIEQRRARREAASASSEDPEGGQIPDIESTELDVAALREQTRSLLQLVVDGLVIMGLWFIWADVLPAFAFLKTVSLGPTLTLDRLLLAILVAVLTFVAARRAPALMEILIPPAIPLQAGGRYAIISLAQYSLVLAGFIVTFNVLGSDWSRIGWILTALSVGLGFGLQEVVANFVCGIILLFERPIRVGDIVTVSEVTGIVSKIRIRATTVTDWDRKEFIVPNKQFVTGHILNWTLSNPVNRLTIPVGIAYGSDTEKARNVILDICRAHPNLLEDPPPFVTFEKFGESSLNLVLRAYIPNLDKRLQTVHDLNTEIHKRFAAEGIVIAFPQLVVHLDAPPRAAGP